MRVLTLRVEMPDDSAEATLTTAIAKAVEKAGLTGDLYVQDHEPYVPEEPAPEAEVETTDVHVPIGEEV